MIRTLVLALCLAAPAACVTSPGGSGDKLQEAVSFMVSTGQHGEGVDIAETTATLDREIAASPNDPYVLKVAAMTRISLADNTSDPATRKKLRTEALAQLEKAASVAGPNAKPRKVTLNGMDMDIGFDDVEELKQQLHAAMTADR
ncbi:MAG TPA: hypothetical protein VG942_10555 [Hyphomonadaceae bacterium]|nr:hypothetical protein [Hyphomonadaceae bacterium]